MAGELLLREDGTFRLVQFTDLHWHNGEKDDRRTRELMARVLEAEKPDLVALTGDLIFGGKCKDPAESLRDAVRVVEEHGAPWAAVLGNHDDEGSLGREALMRELAGRPGCLSELGPAGIGGAGNFVRTVKDPIGGGTAFALYFLDSGAYSDQPSIPGYAWIRAGQIEWVRRVAAELAEANGGAPVPSLYFFHIPLPEHALVWRTRECFGARGEKTSCPRIDSGLFASLLESGGALGVFCGHDHLNDYWGELAGVRLVYGRASGYQGYGKKSFPRGARIIELRREERTFSTWVRLADGRMITEPKRHAPRGEPG